MTRLLQARPPAPKPQIDDIYRQLEARVRADLQRMGDGAPSRHLALRLPALCRAGARASASICRRSLCAPGYAAADRGPLRAGLPGQVRLPPARRRGRGRGLVHRRLGRERRRRRASRQELANDAARARLRRGTRKAYFPEAGGYRRLRRHRPQRAARRRGHRGPRHHRGGGGHHLAAAALPPPRVSRARPSRHRRWRES